SIPLCRIPRLLSPASEPSVPSLLISSVDVRLPRLTSGLPAFLIRVISRYDLLYQRMTYDVLAGEHADADLIDALQYSKRIVQTGFCPVRQVLLGHISGNDGF